VVVAKWRVKLPSLKTLVVTLTQLISISSSYTVTLKPYQIEHFWREKSIIGM
jgi:hypothetical protein